MATPATIEISEANTPQFGRTSTGVVNFSNFTLNALLGPVLCWILQSVFGGAAQIELHQYESTFVPLLTIVATAILLTLVFEGDWTSHLRSFATTVRRS